MLLLPDLLVLPHHKTATADERVVTGSVAMLGKAEDLRCEPAAAAVVNTLDERIKFLSKVACQPVLTMANSLKV